MAIIMDGKKLANEIQENLKKDINSHLEQKMRPPHLVVFLVGNNPASEIYVNHKIRVCTDLKIKVTLKKFDEAITTANLIAIIKETNDNNAIDGILVQLPLPKHLDKNQILATIDYQKDVDGMHYINSGLLFQNLPTIAPCTPLAVLELLKAYQIDVFKKVITVIGTSNLVGKPLAIMLHHLGATVILCDKNTVDLKEQTLNSDIVITAVGVANLVTAPLIRKNTVVIDVAIIRDFKTNKICGDVDFENVKLKASYITPVPKGVGPITIAMLVRNLCLLYFKNIKKTI